MKKRLITGLLIVGVAFSLFGCKSKTPEDVSMKTDVVNDVDSNSVPAEPSTVSMPDTTDVNAESEPSVNLDESALEEPRLIDIETFNPANYIGKPMSEFLHDYNKFRIGAVYPNDDMNSAVIHCLEDTGDMHEATLTVEGHINDNGEDMELYVEDAIANADNLIVADITVAN